MTGSQGANVHSLDALKDIRAALIKFQERAITAMGEMRQRVDRTVDWLELDRPNYWRDQEHRAYDQLATARVAYETCRLQTVGGRRSDCIEEKKAFERAKVRMEYVRNKQQAVRKWMVQAGREANEYRARTSTFQRSLENDVPMMIAQLGRMIEAIESYSETNTPNLVSARVSSLSASTAAVVGSTSTDPAMSEPVVNRADETPGTESHE
jgi:hypothetical protein